MNGGKQQDHRNRQNHHVKPLRQRHGGKAQDQKIPDQHADHHQQNQPDNRGLFKILLKGLEKRFDNIAFLIPHHLQHHIVHCRKRRSDGKERQTADYHQNIQYNQVCQLTQCAHQRTVQVKKSSHLCTLLYFACYFPPRLSTMGVKMIPSCSFLGPRSRKPRR